MSSDTARRECTPESCQFLMVNTIALFHAMMTKILTLAIFRQIIKIIVWTKTKPDLFPRLTLRTFLMTLPGDGPAISDEMTGLCLLFPIIPGGGRRRGRPGLGGTPHLMSSGRQVSARSCPTRHFLQNLKLYINNLLQLK